MLNKTIRLTALLVFAVLGCTSTEKHAENLQANEKSRLEQELSWKIETLKSTYFEGEVIWAIVTPNITHNPDSVVAAYYESRTPNARINYETGDIRVFRENQEVTNALRDLTDSPKPRNIPYEAPSVHRLQRSAQFLREGHYFAFVDRFVKSDTVEFKILPTPDSLFTLRFVLLEDIGNEFTPKFPLHSRVSVPPSSRHAWTRYLQRLRELPQGYPYRSEGLRAAIGALSGLRSELNLQEIRSTSDAFVQLTLEEPFNLPEIAFFAKTWMSELDTSLRKSESEWLEAAVPDTAFTNVFLGIRPFPPKPVVVHPFRPSNTP